MAELNVVSFPGMNLMEVPSCLRKLADLIEHGQLSEAHKAIVVTMSKEGIIESYHYGDLGSRMESIGLLTTAAQFLISEGRI